MNTDSIKDNTKFGITGIFDVYFNSDSKTKSVIKIIWKRYWISILTSVVGTIILFYFGEKGSYYYLSEINSKVFSLLPNLIGFNIGAYALFITLGGSDFLKTLVEYKEKERSHYQKISSIFSIAIILQVFTLFFTFFLEIIIDLEFKSNFYIIINYFVILILFLFVTSSILILIDITTNIFNLSQMYHFSLWKGKKL